MGTAAGLALAGLKPVVYTIAPFTTYRCFEQIRVDVCYNNAPVIIVGTGAGLSYASLGPTHHSMEDVAILRTLPNMTVLCPSGPEETAEGLAAALKLRAPIYIRLGKKGEPDLHLNSRGLEIGKAVNLHTGRDACLIGAGPVLKTAIDAAELLESENITLNIENFHTIKPLDEAKLTKLAQDFSNIIIVEEHGKIGGLYSAVAEFYSEAHFNRPRLHSIAGKDEFIHNIGTQQYAMEYFGISKEAICHTVKSILDL